MNKLNIASHKTAFIMAGDPSLEKSKEKILQAQKQAELVVLTIPFSDPMVCEAEMEAANYRALEAGASLHKILKLIGEIQGQIKLPLVLMSYANPIHNYGYESFFQICQKLDLSGLMVQDMPKEEEGEMLDYAEKYQIQLLYS